MSDLVDVIEASYRVDEPRERWLRNVVTAAYAQMGKGMGVLGFEYRVTPERRLVVGDAVTVDFPEAAIDPMRMAMGELPPWYIEKTFVRCESTTRSAVTDADVCEANRASAEMLEGAFGIKDVLM